MIKSKFILDIVDLLLGGDAEGIVARPQIQHLTDEEYEYNDGGLFVSFSPSEEIDQHKSSKPDLILNGVKITSSEWYGINLQPGILSSYQELVFLHKTYWK